jgi:flagellar biosynthesis/type III secretory pathway chaperone
MTVNCDTLIDSLRDELQEYGGLLGLFNEQQKAILDRKPEAVIAVQEAIVLQCGTIEHCRKRREDDTRRLASDLGRESEVLLPLRGLIEGCEEAVRPLLYALMDEVNNLILKTRRRAQQNQMLLARSIEVSQQLLQKLNPEAFTKTYSRSGRVNLAGAAAAGRCLSKS